MLASIPDILNELRAGRMVVLVDDEDRENEGDLVLAAEFVTPEAINFLTRVAGGYLCLSMTAADCERLNLHPQTAVNTTVRGTPFTVSIDGHPRHGVGTGISAFDRCKTVQLAIDPASGPDDFVRPGHINPLRSRDGGVLVRTGQTEGAVDLCRLAGLYPAALIIEVVREDGRMARREDLEKLCRAHNFRMCSVEQIIAFRLERESLVRRMEPAAGTLVRTSEGEFNLVAFETAVDPLPQFALTLGGIGDLDASGKVLESDDPVLVRMHRQHILGDLLGDPTSSPEGATGDALRAALRAIAREGRGVLTYLRPNSGGEALHERLERARFAGPTHDGTALDAVSTGAAPVAQRDFGIGVQMLRALGVRRARLLTNHPKELPGLEAFGLEIVGQVPLDLRGG